jgi:hypothetical protein
VFFLGISQFPYLITVLGLRRTGSKKDIRPGYCRCIMWVIKWRCVDCSACVRWNGQERPVAVWAWQYR